MFKKMIVLGLMILTVAYVGEAEAPKPHGRLISETYIVQRGDNLWDISAKYAAKNTYGTREIREFYYGIIANNFEAVFKNRQPGELHPGDRLIINYFVKEGVK